MLQVMDGLDRQRCYRAVPSRDPRFDGWFFTGVLTTGIYCRPSCPAVTPKFENVRFFATAAAAQQAGLRACKRCRPDALPGSPEWNLRSDLVGRAMRSILDGVVDREGVVGLSSRLGYSVRHIHRQLVEEVGAGPLALARAQRASTARLLMETTDLSASETAFAAGFGSIRQFNDTIREVFHLTPTELRSTRRSRSGPAHIAGALNLRLSYRQPLAATRLFEFFSKRAIPGVEEGDGSTYRRTLSLHHGNAVVTVTQQSDHVGYLACVLRLDDLRDLTTAIQRTRRALDLDADPEGVSATLGKDPNLGPHVKRLAGLRVPGTVDPHEIAIRAVLGQQVSVAGARNLAHALTMSYGKPLAAPDGSLTHLFPAIETLAEASLDDLRVTASRRAAIRELATAIAEQRLVLDEGVNREEVVTMLETIKGIGPWTAAYIRMRGLGDPDVFLPGDLGVKKALAEIGLTGPPRDIMRTTESWRPWRSYGVQHLWNIGPNPPGKNHNNDSTKGPKKGPENER